MKSKIFIIYSFLLIVSSLVSEAVELRDKIAQMLILGFQGTEFSEELPVAKYIREYHIGGVLLFKRNIQSPTQIQSLNQGLNVYASSQEIYNKNPLFVCADQEGGFVNRFPGSQGFTQSNFFPQAFGEIYASNGKERACETIRGYATEVAQAIKGYGVNVNFAPVVDVLNPKCFIAQKGRCFSSDTSVIFDLAFAFIQGFYGQGVLTTLKHFPGHGNSLQDTHNGFSDVTDTWTEQELLPFRNLIKYANLVMIAHVINRNLEPDNIPATFSWKIVTSLLKDACNFHGIVVSDDLTDMKAITDHYDLRTTLKNAINAGIDMLVLCNHQTDQTEDAIAAIFDLVAKGEISRDRIEDAYQRICNVKQSLVSQ